MRSIAIIFVLIGAVCTAPVFAQTRYITDQLEVDMRTGKTLRHKILRMLPSGAEVEVVEQDNAEGYALIRTADGTQGWVLSRYLDEQPVARERLAAVEQTLDTLQTENQQLRSQFTSLQTDKQNLEDDLQTLEEENQGLSQELAEIHKTAANAIAIGRRNRELEEQMVSMERELEIVQQENLSLGENDTRQWFLSGAGVLLLGGVLGLILPQVRWQRRTRWGDL